MRLRIRNVTGNLMVFLPRNSPQFGQLQSPQLEVRVPAQTVRKLTFQMDAIGRFQGIDPVYFWISSALAVTSIGVGSYFGIDALLEHQQAKDAFDDESLELDEGDEEYDDLVKQKDDANQKIEDLQLKADIFLYIGGGLVLSSIVLFFLTDWGSTEETPAVSRVKPSLFITTQLSKCGLQGNLVGHF